jgi:hypothetical protein
MNGVQLQYVLASAAHEFQASPQSKQNLPCSPKPTPIPTKNAEAESTKYSTKYFQNENQ